MAHASATTTRLAKSLARSATLFSSLDPLAYSTVLSSLPSFILRRDAPSSNSTAVRLDMGFRQHFHSSIPSQISTSNSTQISETDYSYMYWEDMIGVVDVAHLKFGHLMKALWERYCGLARRTSSEAGIDNTSVLQATNQFIAQQPKWERLLIHGNEACSIC